MNKICTSIDQSKKLIELGIDINTADTFWDMAEPEKRRTPTVGLISDYYDMEDWAIPAWSLSALLDLPPKGEDNNIDLCFGGYNGEEYIDEWFCTFEDNKEPFEFHTCNNKDKLDATFEMIVYLKENNKL